MPIFDQGYQHWSGKLAGHAWRWLAVTRRGVRVQLRSKWTWAALISAWAPALALAAALILWGLFERQSSLLQPLMFVINGLPPEIKAGPTAYRSAFWTMAFHFFFEIQAFFVMMLVVLVGPDLISQDLRFNAIPLYFSRPLRRIDYFLGKLGVIGAFLLAVSVFPALLAYLLGIAFSFNMAGLRDTFRLLASAVGYGLILIVSAGTLMLAISSLSRNSRLVSAIFIAVWVLGSIGSNVLQETVEARWCPLVSYTGNLARVRDAMIDSDSARAKFLALADAGRQAAMGASPYGGGRRRRWNQPAPPPPTAEQAEEKMPWAWSAGVLAGVFVLSAWTLSTRVRSLDRLK